MRVSECECVSEGGREGGRTGVSECECVCVSE